MTESGAIGRPSEATGPNPALAFTWVQLLFLCGFAVAQPLYDLLGRNAEFFVARRSLTLDLWILVFALSLGLPTLLWILELSVGVLAGVGARKSVHGGCLAILSALAVLPWVNRSGLPSGWLSLAIASSIGVVVGIWMGRHRLSASKGAIWLLAIAAMVFPLRFVAGESVRKIAWPRGGSVGSGESESARLRAPVVLIVFDELALPTIRDAAGDIDRTRFPSFARLADDATWYTQATTVANSTALAVPAILTGRYPNPRFLPNAEDYPRNVFTLFGKRIDLVVFESITQLCPSRLCTQTFSSEPLGSRMDSLSRDLLIVYQHLMLPEDLASSLPPIDNNWRSFGGTGQQPQGSIVRPGNPLAFVDRFLSSLRTTEEPALYYLHLLLPHVPWQFSPSGHRYGPPDQGKFPHGLRHEVWSQDSWHAVQGFQRYLHQAMFTDRVLGRILDRLQEIGLYQDSLVIVLADHGVSFRPGDSRRVLTDTNYREILPVPLLVKVPGQTRGARSDRNVETIDILPTLVDFADDVPDWSFDGTSLLEPSPERSGKAAVRQRDGKLLRFESPILGHHEIWAEIPDPANTEDTAIYALGPHHDLWGRTLRELTSEGLVSGDQSSAVVELDWPGALDDVNPEDPLQPLHLTGKVRGPDEEYPLHMGLAINGIVVALTRTYDDDGVHRFSAMIPEGAVVPGANTLEVFAIEKGPGGTLDLAEIGTSKLSFSLSVDDLGRDVIRATDGQIFAVQPGVLGGHLDLVQESDDEVVLVGWAADLEALEPAQRVLIFVDEKLLYSGTTQIERPGLAGSLGSPLRFAGFRYGLPKRLFASAVSEPVRLFAINRTGRATELVYPVGFGWGGRYELTSSGDEDFLRGPDGSLIPIVEGTFTGRLTSPSVKRQRIVFQGWAFDSQRLEAPDRILLFADGKYVHSIRPRTSRPELEKGHGISSSIGFDMRIPLDFVAHAASASWRLFALSRQGFASELIFPEGVKTTGAPGILIELPADAGSAPE